MGNMGQNETQSAEQKCRHVGSTLKLPYKTEGLTFFCMEGTLRISNFKTLSIKFCFWTQTNEQNSQNKTFISQFLAKKFCMTGP
jgi:hypothetical protein